jgi:hypothetical protein
MTAAVWWVEPCLWDDEPPEPVVWAEPEPVQERAVEDVPTGDLL